MATGTAALITGATWATGAASNGAPRSPALATATNKDKART